MRTLLRIAAAPSALAAGRSASAGAGSRFNLRDSLASRWAKALRYARARTGVRVAEGTGLENRHTRKGIEGSNPSLSVPAY